MHMIDTILCQIEEFKIELETLLIKKEQSIITEKEMQQEIEIKSQNLKQEVNNLTLKNEIERLQILLEVQKIVTENITENIKNCQENIFTLEKRLLMALDYGCGHFEAMEEEDKQTVVDAVIHVINNQEKGNTFTKKPRN